MPTNNSNNIEEDSLADKKSELEEQIQDGQESIDLALKEIAKLKERKAQLESELSDFRDNQTLYGRKLLLEKQLATLESSPIQQPIKPEVVEQRDYTAEKTSLMREKDIVMRYNASLRVLMVYLDHSIQNDFV